MGPSFDMSGNAPTGLAQISSLPMPPDTTSLIQNHTPQLRGAVSSLPVELLGCIMLLAIRSMKNRTPRISETDPTQMVHLRLSFGEGLLINLDLWRSTERLQRLAGADSPPLRIVICGSIEEEGQQGGILINQILSILFGHHRNWTEWSFSSMRLLWALRLRGGLREENMDAYTRVIDQLKNFSADFPCSSSWEGGRYSWTPLSYGLLDSQDKKSLGWESMYLSIQGIGVKATIVPNSFPSRLRFLHIHGYFLVSFPVIFEAPLLEELVFETSRSAFHSIDRKFATSHSLQRLILIGNASFTNYVYRPSDTLIINRFFERSGLTEIELSLEDSNLESGNALKSVLDAFAKVEISKLFLDTPVPLIHLPTAEFHILQKAVRAVACRSGFTEVVDPKQGKWALPGPNPGISKPLLMLPSAFRPVPEVLAKEMDVHVISHQEIDTVFDHNIQSHQYVAVYS
ncbi:hypothetical protein BKA70DRAFT_1306847 [Coprinopsis sp. MPI-PUGE-AT-0042]|nr:hypothetical protein BKA70DRAFT_1306847 [Coprinopsis sp. MPI-PUGE-AT-0042]